MKDIGIIPWGHWHTLEKAVEDINKNIKNVPDVNSNDKNHKIPEEPWILSNNIHRTSHIKVLGCLYVFSDHPCNFLGSCLIIRSRA